MKKLFCLALAFVLILSACEKSMFPVDDQHKKYGNKAIEIADQFLDFDISINEAYEKLKALEKSASSMPSVDKDSKYYDGNKFVENRVEILVSGALLATIKDDTSQIVDYRNAIAEILGVANR